MAARRRFIALLLTAFSLLAGAVGVVVSQDYTAYRPYCSTTDNYTHGKPVRGEPLSELRSELRPGALGNGGFWNASAGDAVFGLIMCFADRDWEQCQNCIRNQLTCPFSREMKACFDVCVLRYSNQSFFSVADLTMAYYVPGNTFVADMAGMDATRRALMSWVSTEAAALPAAAAGQRERGVFRDYNHSSQPICSKRIAVIWPPASVQAYPSTPSTPASGE